MNQYVQCFAHVINLTVQKILHSLKAENNIELENDDIPTEKTTNFLYKVSFILFILINKLYLLINLIKFLTL